MKLELLDFFNMIQFESYVVIKPSELLPDYKEGSDIDIFCYHPEKILNHISIFLSSYVDLKSSISIFETQKKIHVDFMHDKKINFRFDIYKSLPEYRNVCLKQSFFSSVIESAEVKAFSDGCNIKIPAVIDDLILRYVEYQEYYSMRPDKIKHIEYIEKKMVGNNNLENMLDKLHYYTSFPEVEYKTKTLNDRLRDRKKYYYSIVVKAKSLYKTAGIKSLISKILEKIRSK